MIARRKLPLQRFAIEGLEERALLTIFDLATISGRVFRDGNGNGFNSGEEVSGANVELYKDFNGNGQLDGGDTLSKTTQTDSNGVYKFERLTIGTYFVVQPAQGVGEQALPEVTSSPIVLTINDVDGTRGTTIDNFNQTTHSTFATPAQPSGISVASAPEAIGGTRKLQATSSGPDGGLALSANTTSTGPGVLDFHESGGGGVHQVTWDGTSPNLPRQAQASFNPRGLGGVDLTDGGASTGLALLIAGDIAGGQLQILLNSSFTNISSASVVASHTGPRNASQLYPLHEVYVPFSSFTSGAGGAADLTDIGAIRMTWLNDQSRANGQIDQIETVGPTVITQDFSNSGGGGETQLIDLELAMDVGEPTPSGEVVFTLTLENAGSTTATNVRVSDVLPDGLTFLTASSPNYDNNTGLWSITQLAANGSTMLSITARIDGTGTFTNVAQVSAADQLDVDSVPGNNLSSEDDQASAAITIQNTALSLVTKINGLDANSPTGPLIPLGEQATFTYELTNTGSDLLTLNSLIDDNGTPSDSSDDIDVLDIGDFLGGDSGTLGVLDPGETWTYALEKILSEAGQYVSTGSAAASVTGGTIGEPSISTDSDPANAFVVSSGVQLEMQVNGQDANSPSGAVVPLGSQPVFSYLVRNVGNIPVRDLFLIDDNGTPSDTLDDIYVAEQGQFRGGDSGLEGILDPGETWTFQLSKSSLSTGEFTANASVSGSPTDLQGNELSNAEPVSDEDPVHFLVQKVNNDVEDPVDIAVGIVVREIPEVTVEELSPTIPAVTPAAPPLEVFIPITQIDSTVRTLSQIVYGNSQRMPDAAPLALPRATDSTPRLRFYEIPEEQLQQVLLTLAETVVADAEVADLADVQLARAPAKLTELPRDYLEAPEEPLAPALGSAPRWYLAAVAGLTLAGSLTILAKPKILQSWIERHRGHFGRDLRQISVRARKKITSVFAHSWW